LQIYHLFGQCWVHDWWYPHIVICWFVCKDEIAVWRYNISIWHLVIDICLLLEKCGRIHRVDSEHLQNHSYIVVLNCHFLGHTCGFKIISNLLGTCFRLLVQLGWKASLLVEVNTKATNWNVHRELYLLQFTVLILSQLDEIEFWGDSITVWSKMILECCTLIPYHSEFSVITCRSIQWFISWPTI
jgi:hypothetical protein